MQKVQRNKEVILQIAIYLAFAMVLLDTSIVNVAIHAIQIDLKTNMVGLEWVMNSYSIAFSALLLSAGLLGEKFGSKAIFLIGFFIFIVGSLCCGLSNTLLELIIFRVVQGIGAALLVPTSLILISTLFKEPASRAKAISLWGASGSIALVSGPIIGGLIISHFGWKPVFFLNLIPGVMSIWIVSQYMPRSAIQKNKSLDIFGQIIGILMLVSFTYALIEIGQLGYRNPLVMGSFLISMFSLIVFIIIERKHASPMLPLTIFKQPIIRSTIIIGLIANLTFYGMIFVLSVYFQSIKGYSPQKTGLSFIPMMGGLVFINVLSGRLIPTIGAKKVMILGLNIATLGYLFLIIVNYDSVLLLSICMLLAGGGIALAVPAIVHTALSNTELNSANTVSGLLNMFRQIGGVIGVAMFGALINSNLKPLFIHNMKIALLLSAMFLIYGVWLILNSTKNKTSNIYNLS